RMSGFWWFGCAIFHLYFPTYQNLVRPLPSPDTRIRLSGLKLSQAAEDLGFIVNKGSPPGNCHNRIVSSSEPEANILLSGLKATVRTSSPCPVRVSKGLPVSTDQTRTVASLEPLANILLSGLKAVGKTQWVWPFKICTISPVVADQTRTVRSSEPLASHLPSRLQTTLSIQLVCPTRFFNILP